MRARVSFLKYSRSFSRGQSERSGKRKLDRAQIPSQLGVNLTENLLLVAGKVDGLDTANLLGSNGSSGELLDTSGAGSVQSSAEVSALLLDSGALGLLQCGAESSAGSTRRHDDGCVDDRTERAWESLIF
jgi:hypothetical protein